MNKNLLVGIVDDDDIFHFSMNLMIKRVSNHISVSCYMNGSEAMIHLKNHIHDGHLIPDLLLLDINMPVMDGWQFLVEIALLKDRLIKVPAIYLVSSSDWPADKLQALKYPMVNAFRSKPIFENDLRNIFENVASHKSLNSFT